MFGEKQQQAWPNVSMKLLASLAPARAEVEAGVVAKAEQLCAWRHHFIAHWSCMVCNLPLLDCVHFLCDFSYPLGILIVFFFTRT